MANGLNANMPCRWVKEANEYRPGSAHKDTAAVVPAFVQLPMPQAVQSTRPPASAQAPDTLSLEIRRGSTTVQAELPLDARNAVWLREVLR